MGPVHRRLSRQDFIGIEEPALFSEPYVYLIRPNGTLYVSPSRRPRDEAYRNSGITVLTATRADQLAVELPEFGHGVFTHVILDGLSGRAAAANSGGKVSAHQLANYVGANLARLA